jgi:hypothetical protein
MPPRFTYSRYREGCAAENPPQLIPSPRFKADYFMGDSELRRLLRKHVLVAKKFKGTVFVGINPCLEQQGLKLEYFRDV